MASTIKIKRSSVAAKVPTTADINSGELALNITDRKLYSSNGTTVFEIGTHKLSVSNAAATYQTKAIERSALANTNLAITNVKTGLTSTNTALRTLISDRLQVANAATLYTTKSNPTTSGLLAHTGRATISTNLNVSGNTVIGKLVANGSLGTSGYALKTNGSTVYWDAVGAGGAAGATWAALTSTNTALRTLISDRLQVANASATYQTKAVERAALANTNSAISNVKTGLTSTNTAIRTLVSDRLQVANAAALYTTKSNPTTSGLLAHTGRATISTNLAVSGNTTISSTLGVTGVATFAAGTALLPALTTSGDTNTGVWFPAADTLAASTAGSERIRITSAGNVGIGTTAPAYILHSYGGAVTNPTNFLSQGYIANLAVGTRTGTIRNSFDSNMDFGTFWTSFRGANGSTYESRFGVRTGGVDIDVLTLNSSGKVGIGATAPDGKLDIETGGGTDVVAALGGTFPAFTYRNGTGSWFHAGKHPSSDYFYIGRGATPTTSVDVVVDSGGRLIIGNNASINVLSVEAGFQNYSGDGYITAGKFAADAFAPFYTFLKSRNATVGAHTIVQNGDDLGTIAFTGSDGTNFIRGAQIRAQVDGTPGTNDMPGRLTFFTTADGASSPSERMRIDSSGNVGIGTSSLSIATKLEVYGNSAAAHVGIRANNAAADGYATLWLSNAGDNTGIIRGGPSAAVFANQLAMVTNTAIPITFNPNNTERMRIESGGVVRPGADNTQTLGSASYRWSVVYAGTGTINTSDEREKQQIANLDDAERRVAVAIKGLVKKYKYNDAVTLKGDDARIHVGVIAQEVIAAFAAEGLDATRYALLCHDTWEAEQEETDDEGNVTKPARDAGERYGIRYNELLAFMIAAL